MRGIDTGKERPLAPEGLGLQTPRHELQNQRQLALCGEHCGGMIRPGILACRAPQRGADGLIPMCYPLHLMGPPCGQGPRSQRAWSLSCHLCRWPLGHRERGPKVGRYSLWLPPLGSWARKKGLCCRPPHTSSSNKGHGLSPHVRGGRPTPQQN